jgi:Na+-transporting NADH:ubiquinone oxidoreductase subunit F
MLAEIVIPILLLTAIVVGLAALVLLARHWLEPQGQVTIEINGDRKLMVKAGEPLLWALAEQGIYLPAACGGRGSCGQCRIKVLTGGGPMLANESVHIDRQQADDGMRLACMVKLRGPTRIEIPSAVLGARRWECTVLANRCITTFLKELTLTLPAPERIHFAAGDYVLLEAPPHRVAFRDFSIDPPFRKTWEDSGLLSLESVSADSVTRAYSLANPPQQDDRIVLVVRIAPPPRTAPAAPPGCVSSYVFSCAPGDTVAISGPFGSFHVADGDGELIFIAGGAGIAPIRAMLLDQFARGVRRKMSFWYGCRDTQDLCYYDELNELARLHDNFDFHVALSSARPDEPWTGHRGFIHEIVYEAYLKNHPLPAAVDYYLCGPPLMSSAVLDMLESLGVDRRRVNFDDFDA